MTQYSDHLAPEGLRTRGTVVVVPGRGETRATYTRFARRLAADAYRVRVVDGPDLGAGLGADLGAGPGPDLHPEELSASLAAFAARITDAVEGTASDEGVVEPVVFVGADSGAAALAALLSGARAEAQAGVGADTGTPPLRRPDALVLAGLPGRAAGTLGSWDDELAVRTSCPTHRGVLTEDTQVRRGALDDAFPDALLTAVHDGDIDVPVLLLVGDTDPLADHEALARTAKSLPSARLSVVRGAHHDVLNDLQHRSTAAEVVTFLEALRDGLRPAVTVHSSAW
ncbi:serine aminopeptidase domain-containing protein [Streptomyces sp. NPDC088387]|uniref:serine aminopeptidase domain-containing protein n=1 Tax=Streptomyces sp. NPDC088387 TaxID=3365859 RepID=UPI0038070FF0